MTISIPTDPSSNRAELARRKRESLVEHQLLEHIGLPADPHCSLCRAGIDPLTVGIAPSNVDELREHWSQVNRARAVDVVLAELSGYSFA